MTEKIAWGRRGSMGTGELRHYPYRSYGFFGWRCACGAQVEMKLRKSGKLENLDKPVELEFLHRNRTRRYTSKVPLEHEILKRFESVMSYAGCRIPWR